MNRLDLYNLALSLMDLKLDDLDGNSKELNLLNLNYRKVVSFCLKAWDFPFLIKQQKLIDHELDTKGNPIGWNSFIFGYSLPPDFGRAIQLNASKNIAYSYRFGRLWCNIACPSLEYMPKELETDEQGEYTAPDDFLSLVAYQLALHAAPSLDPESTAMNNAAQLYQLTLSSIMESEIHSNDRPDHYGASPTWDEENIISQEMLRNAIVKGTV